VVLDCGGGYGGAPYKALKENGITVKAYKGSERSTARTVDGKLGLHNKRTEVYWRFREALDPSQQWGSPIALPPDQELLADLTAPRYEVRNGAVVLERAEKVKERIGRSPDKGSAVVLAWSEGQKAIAHLYSTEQGRLNAEMGLKRRNRKPQVVLGKRYRARELRKMS